MKVQKERLKCLLIKVRFVSLLQQVSTIVSYSPAYNAADVMDSDNLVSALKSQIQISAMLIGTVRKSSVEPKVLAKRWVITPENAQNTIQATT